MLKRERQAYIVHQVNLHNKVLSDALSNQITVSEDTIRRDLPELNEKGKLIKVYGGALSHSFSNISYPSKKVYAQNNKKIIAQKAANLNIPKKINTIQPVMVCDVSKIDMLKTELPNDHLMLQPFVAAGITVL